MDPQISQKNATILNSLKEWAKALGFEALGVAAIHLPQAETGLAAWLDKGFHGHMDYMVKHGLKRAQPDQLVPGTVSVISLRMHYWPKAANAQENLGDSTRAYVSRYALGRDYHKLMRQRLQSLAERLDSITPHQFRVFVDSAPVMEGALAHQAGLGWRGKNTLVIDRTCGSTFFLGEIYTSLPLPVSEPVSDHCGRCRACLDICPTQAIVAPYQLDARRCISYLTIEHPGAIPEEFRPKLGNRIYGCDDCQLVCPWNRFARTTQEIDFSPRNKLDTASLIQLFQWSEEYFLTQLAGSPIRRIGYERWLRNIAVALGNAPSGHPEVVAALQKRQDHESALVREHVNWALQQHLT